ncbi:hypothetical protein FMM66_00010, partial [[Clostridium] cocleatum]
WEGNIPWISSSDLFDNDIRTISINRHITNDAILNSSAKLCPKSTICIVSRVGVGKVAVSKCEICTSQDFMNIIEYDGNKYFLAQLIQIIIKSTQLQGTSIKGITSKEINNFKLQIPTISEQDKIMQFLELIEDRIQTQSKIIDLYTSLIKSIEDNIFWNNTDYHSLPIKKILTEIIEKSIIQNQYPILSSTKQGIFLQSEYFNKEAASSNNIGYKITHKGDIIISPQNLWMGNINYNDKFENGLVSPSYHIYQINKMFNPIYISEILKTRRALFMYKTISEQGASIVRRNLNIDAFSELYFPIPDRKKQDEISLIISKLHQKINIEKCLLDQYKNQKNYLLRNMFI